MKKLLLLLLLLSFKGFTQDSFKNASFVKSYYVLQGNDTVFLKKTESKFSYRSVEEQNAIKKRYPLGSKLKFTAEKDFDGNKITVTDSVTVTQEFYDEFFGKEKEVLADFDEKKFILLTYNTKATLKFDDDKEGRLLVNPYLVYNDNGNTKTLKIAKESDSDSEVYTDKGIYYFDLKNRQAIKVKFVEGMVSALTIPFKYRFKQQGNIKEEFSADINANIFAGIAFGHIKYFHRKDVGNIENKTRFTVGAFLGGSTVTLNSSNTSASTNPLPDDTEIVKGLASIGTGLVYSFNKFNFGGFVGWDYAIGEDAEKWNYNKKPWLGVALGLTLFE